MLCQICNKNQANVFLRKTINGETTQYNLCEECAAKNNVGFEMPSSFMSAFNTGISGLFGDMLTQPLTPPVYKSCPQCGSTLRSIMSSGKVGCGECYSSFMSELAPSISRIHGNTVHAGKIPSSLSGKLGHRRKLDSLKRELDNAIREQEYEKAAKLRDQIKELEAQSDKEGA
ncbi:MAG: UvrB/UvrC motif-containing protein [Eubacteriales bacterium]